MLKHSPVLTRVLTREAAVVVMNKRTLQEQSSVFDRVQNVRPKRLTFYGLFRRSFHHKRGRLTQYWQLKVYVRDDSSHRKHSQLGIDKGFCGDHLRSLKSQKKYKEMKLFLPTMRMIIYWTKRDLCRLSADSILMDGIPVSNVHLTGSSN
jgi:hypothetical protein